MQVLIHEQPYDYVSDYSPGHQKWKVKLKDAFCFEQVGPTRCFIKRFTDKPAAWEMIEKLKGKPVTNIPKIYDAVSTTENNKPIWYLFTEYVAGKTLKEQILENATFDSKKLLINIADALQFIHEHQHWFSDLNEENIYCLPNGNFYLIDVDSCWPLSVRPTHDINQPGGIPGAAQEYANVALEFFREIQGVTNFQYEDIDGKNLNYLQLLALLAKLDYYAEARASNPGFKYMRKNFKGLHHHLLYKNEAYCRNVFSRAFNNQLVYGMVLGMGNFVTGEIAAPEVLDRTPIIDFFKAASYSIYKGESVTLEWAVKNADMVQLDGDARYTVTGSQSKTVSPPGNQVYTLTVRNNSGKEISRTVQVTVLPAPVPQIQQFQATATKIKKGQTVTFSWSVINAAKLFFNGNELPPTVNAQQLSPVKTATYTLLINNSQGKADSRQVKVAVQSANAWWKIFAVALLVVGAIVLWQVTIKSKFDDKVSSASSASYGGNYDRAISLYTEAQSIGKSLLFGGKDLTDEINDNHYRKLKKEGDSYLEGDNTTAAETSWKDALSYKSGDVSIQQRLDFLTALANGRTSVVQRDYANAASFFDTAIELAQKAGLSSSVVYKVQQRKDAVSKPDVYWVKTWMDHGITENNEYGMRIHMSFRVLFMSGKTCHISTWFYNSSGERLLDTNQRYYTTDGQVSTGLDINIPNNDYTFTDVQMFMPYNEMGISSSGLYKFKQGVFNNSTQVGADSDYTFFNYTIN